MACLLPVLAYGAEAWWPDHHRQGKQRPISYRVGAAFSCLENVSRQAIQGSLPVYRTTPVPIIHREASITPTLRTLFLSPPGPSSPQGCPPRWPPPSLQTPAQAPTTFPPPQLLGGPRADKPSTAPPWQLGTLRDRARICPNRPTAPRPPGLGCQLAWCSHSR